MHDSLKFGRIGGVQVGANWSLFALGAAVAYILAQQELPAAAGHYASSSYWLAGTATALGLLAAVLAHELAHAMAARRARMKVDGITLWFMGGVTRIEGESQKPSTELMIALVGPLASAAIGGAALLGSAWAQANSWSLAAAATYWLGAINLFLAAFNLLPASPLDGGRVFHGLVWLVTGNRWWATRAASAAGVLLGALSAAAGWLVFQSDALSGAALLLMAWFIMSSSKREALIGRARHVLGEVQVSDVMRPAYLAPSWLTADAFWHDWVAPYPEAAFLLERWNGDGYDGVVTAHQLAAVPPKLRSSVRARDVAVPLLYGQDGKPVALQADDPGIEIAGRNGLALMVEDQGRPVGAVLAVDVAAMVAQGSPARRRTWADFWPAPVAQLQHPQ